MNWFLKGWLKFGSRFQGKHEFQNKTKRYPTDLLKGSHINRSYKQGKIKRGNMEVFSLLTPHGFLISKCNLETRTCSCKSNLDNNNNIKIFTALIKTKKTMHCN
jgi:hypothetical protein